MRNKSRMFLNLLVSLLLILTNVKPLYAENINGDYLVTDAFVSNFNGQSNTNMLSSKPDKLIVGKGRHAYMLFDLTNVEKDTIENMVLNMTKSHEPNTFVITECSNFLRLNASTDSAQKWNENNITYNNRPIDIVGAPVKEYEISQSGEKNYQLDLTDILLAALESGRTEVSIHITTKDVDNSTKGASEIYSSRATSKNPYLDIAYSDSEEPVELKGINVGNYLSNSQVALKVFTIRNATGQTVKVHEDGSIRATANNEEPSKFALYAYDYGDDNYNEGASKTTYAIKCLDNNKYLTIQNYFGENDSDKTYYNLVGTGRYDITATAKEVNWNERFYIDYFENSKYYNISSHLNTMRDDPSFATVPVRMDSNAMYSENSKRGEYKYYFDEIENNNLLEVQQEVNGYKVTLSWKPVNGDTEVNNYSSENSNIVYQDGYFKTVIDNVATGTHTYTVTYQNGSNFANDTVGVRVFNHPGVLHSEEKLELMKERIENKLEPWYSDYQKLQNTVPDNLSSPNFNPITHDGVGRGTPEGHGNMGDYEQSANAAYFNALQWVITGDDKYGQKTVEILNKWSNDLKVIDGRDSILGAAISSYKFINAAEIMRYYHDGYKGYQDADFKSFQDMMKNVVYPVIQDLGLPMIANGNWDTAAMISMISIGVICDDVEIYDRAVNLYQDIHVNGSIAVYVSDWGQSVESARDQAHAQLGIGYMAEVCQVALNQGSNLYSLYDNRLAKAFEWAAKYNLYSEDIEFKPLMNVFGDSKRGYWTKLDSEKINRGELRPVYELPLAYYSKIANVDMTWTEKAASAMRAQGYVHNDNLNFGTLTTYNGSVTSPYEPYFQLRTRLEPWYQRTWTTIGGVDYAETVNSYFDIGETGELTVSSQKSTAPFYQLVNNQDGTYSIRYIPTNKYLSIKDEMVGDQNIIKVDATKIGDNEKFIFQSNGANFYYLRSPKYDNRIVYVDIQGSDSKPEESILTLRLGSSTTTNNSEVTNNEKFIIMYNIKDVALAGIDLADTSKLQALINDTKNIKNDNAKYTLSSYNTFLSALNNAIKGVVDASNGKIAQDEVDKLYTELNNAFENLEIIKNGDVSGNTDDGNKGGSDVSNGGQVNITPQKNAVSTGDSTNTVVFILLFIISVYGFKKYEKNI